MTIETELAALQASVSALQAPTIDLSPVLNAVAALAAQVAAIQAQLGTEAVAAPPAA